MMEKVVSYSSSFEKSINWKKIGEITNRISFGEFDVNKFNWANLVEIHIISNVVFDEDNNDITVPNLSKELCGIYVNDEMNWLLAVGNDIGNIIQCLPRCNSALMTLDIRFTSFSYLNLDNLIGLKKLDLSYNYNLKEVQGLEKLHELRHLDMKYTCIEEIPELDKFENLVSVNIRSSKIECIVLKDELVKLKYADFAYTLIDNCSFIVKFPIVEIININGSNVKELPDLSALENLRILNCSYLQIEEVPLIGELQKFTTLNLSYTNISRLENAIFPLSIRTLSLEGTSIKALPQEITKLKNLRKLNLRNMELESLPAEIVNLNLEFNLEKKGFGICLQNTIIRNIDMSLFQQPRAIIEEWFIKREEEPLEAQSYNPLNEMKVVFLGDGGAGKSYTIQRMLNNGETPNDFDGNSTPGISINNRCFSVSDNRVLLHFWDFGGQEIMHSMHRMFLTKRTFYIVFVNARDNTQDERARYWLNNIKSFAGGSKVLLVINQIDQNPSASVNEPALRALYPQLTQIIKMSAVKSTQEEFTEILQNRILDEIGKMTHIKEPFLMSWWRLKSKLQSMEDYYIDAETFTKMGEECGVVVQDEVRVNLLDWFGDLGISFCYRDNSVLSNYMVLRPDWITNAIYIILFNGSCRANNGLIKHEDLYEILRIPDKSKAVIRRVIDGLSYSPTETEYVLGVIRKFRLSYRMNDDVEFIPMLCDRNENSVVNSFYNEEILEFHMEYSYLPNNVLHRLMVEMRNDLVHEYVWLSGAVFASKTMGLKALVKIDGDTLKIYVKSESELYTANVYLGFIRNIIDNINGNLGLSSREIIVYKKEDQIEEFEYEYLTESYKHGNKLIYSKKLKRNVPILDILNQTDGDIEMRKNNLINDIIDACTSLQNYKANWSACEDDRNTYIRDIMRGKGYSVADQTLAGKSYTGKSPGELDLQIMEKSDKPWAIYEALNLSSFSNSDKEIWNNHLAKLLDNYNPIGLPYSFLVSYVNCKKDEFKEYWLKYYNYLSQKSVHEYMIQKAR
jgi:internalin A